MGLVLFLAQCFSLLPLLGIYGDIRNVRFKVCSFRFISAALLIIMGCIEGCLALKRTFHQEVSFGDWQHVIFIIECTVTAILFVKLSRNWGDFIRYWESREDCLIREPYVIKGMKLKTKLYTITLIIFILSLVEHILFWISTAVYDFRQYTICKIKHISFIQFLFMKERPHIFMFIPYSHFLIVPVLWTSFCLTICWNVIDILIIVTSICLATRFEQINERILIFYKQPVPDMFWLEIRKHYVYLIQILERVDQEMSILIVLSCASNLFSICYQLFNSVKYL